MLHSTNYAYITKVDDKYVLSRFSLNGDSTAFPIRSYDFDNLPEMGYLVTETPAMYLLLSATIQ